MRKKNKKPKKTNPTVRSSFLIFFKISVFVRLGLEFIANSPGRFWVLWAWGACAENIVSIGLRNPRARCLPGWAEPAENTAGLWKNICPSFVRRFFEGSIFSLNISLCWFSHFWQTDAQTENLLPHPCITAWFHLKHWRNLPCSPVVFLQVMHDSFSHS